jgi:phosphomannomutase
VLVTRANGWALVLPHGSQPLVHVRAEGDTEADLEAILREWTAVVESAIGAD